MLAAVGISALVWAVNGLITKEPGWTEIEADSSGEPTCAADFNLFYNAGADGSDPTAQIKTLTALYTDVSADAEKLFSVTAHDDDIHGISLLNANVNKQVTVEKEVYDALLLFKESKSREMFLAPVYEQYNTLFFCSSDEEAETLDPASNEEQRDVISEMIAFVSDPYRYYFRRRKPRHPPSLRRVSCLRTRKRHRDICRSLLDEERLCSRLHGGKALR